MNLPWRHGEKQFLCYLGGGLGSGSFPRISRIHADCSFFFLPFFFLFVLTLFFFFSLSFFLFFPLPLFFGLPLSAGFLC